MARLDQALLATFASRSRAIASTSMNRASQPSGPPPSRGPPARKRRGHLTPGPPGAASRGATGRAAQPTPLPAWKVCRRRRCAQSHGQGDAPPLAEERHCTSIAPTCSRPSKPGTAHPSSPQPQHSPAHQETYMRTACACTDADTYTYTNTSTFTHAHKD